MKTTYLYGRPWPEAIAGAIFGAQVGIGLALVPALNPFVQNLSTAPIVLAITALIGALASWWIAGRSIGVARTKLESPVVLERERRRAA
jgi:hypothetical protein